MDLVRYLPFANLHDLDKKNFFYHFRARKWDFEFFIRFVEKRNCTDCYNVLNIKIRKDI
jgi:hypothetical protein